MSFDISFFSNTELQRAVQEVTKLNQNDLKNPRYSRYQSKEVLRQASGYDKNTERTNKFSYEDNENYERGSLANIKNNRNIQDKLVMQESKNITVQIVNNFSTFPEKPKKLQTRKKNVVSNKVALEERVITVEKLVTKKMPTLFLLARSIMNLDSPKDNILIKATMGGENQLLFRCLNKSLRGIVNHKGVGQTTLMMEICKNPDIKTHFIARVFKLGGFINDCDLLRNTSLHYAVYAKSYHKATLLLKFGANPNSVNIYGSSPLHFACKHGNMMLIRLLVKHGALLEVKNCDGYTPLMYCAENYDTFKQVSYLLKCGAQANRTDNNGFNALMKAVICNNHAGVRALLMSSGINLLHVNNCGFMCYMYAPTEKILHLLINGTSLSDLSKAMNNTNVQKNYHKQLKINILQNMKNAYIYKIEKVCRKIPHF